MVESEHENLLSNFENYILSQSSDIKAYSTMNNKSLFFIVFLLTSINLLADTPQLKSVTMTLDPMTSSMQRFDANGHVCGLVKVILPNPGVAFEGNIIGDTDYKISEYWCYLSPNTKFLKVKYPKLEPLMIDFTKFFPNGIQSKRIYEVNILIPNRIQSTGTPIRINLKTQRDYFYPWALEECRVRCALVGKPEYVDIYINMRNGTYDNHIRVNSDNFKECLVGDIHKDDLITIIPDRDTYVKKNIIVADSVFTNKLLNVTIPRRGVDKRGILIDKSTQKPIEGASVNFYNINNTTLNHKDFIYGSSTTNKDGGFTINNCFSKYIYNIRISAPGYKFNSFDVIADTTFLKHELEPLVQNIKVLDGKKPIEGVKIYCKNLYDEIFCSNSNGDIEIIGALDNEFTISHPEYETLVITREWDNPMIIKMKKGTPGTIRHAKYDHLKDKLIFK